MNAANQDRADTAHAGEALASQYQTMLDGWAEVSRCCLEAADEIYHTGMDYVKDQTERLHEMTCNPAAAMREELYSDAVNASFDAADRITHAYLHTLETAREPMMRVVSAQLPLSRHLAETMEKGMKQGLETMEREAERMEKGMERGMRGAAEAAERGAEEASEPEETRQQHHGRQQGRSRKSA